LVRLLLLSPKNPEKENYRALFNEKVLLAYWFFFIIIRLYKLKNYISVTHILSVMCNVNWIVVNKENL